MNTENIQYSINLIKLYKLSLQDIVSYIEAKYKEIDLDTLKKDKYLQEKLNQSKATINLKLRTGKSTLTSLLDNKICFPINLKQKKVVYERN